MIRGNSVYEMFSPSLSVSTSKTQSHSNSTSKSTSDESRRSATSRSATCLRDSGVPAETGGGHETSTTTTVVLRKSAINNSLLDLTTDSSGHGSHHDARGHHHDRGHHPGHHAEKMARRGSVGSLDSGMSVSFHNTSAATATGNGNGKLKYAANSKQTGCKGLNRIEKLQFSGTVQALLSRPTCW